MKKILKGLAILIVLSFAIALIYLLNLGVDNGLFSDKPCAAPCWQGLMPGRSTEADVNQFIQIANPRDWLVKRDYTSSTGVRVISLEYKPDSLEMMRIKLSVENGILILVETSPAVTFGDDQVPLQLRPFGAIVIRFGEPEYIESVFTVGPVPGGGSYYPLLIYPQKGLAFMLNGNKAPENLHPFLSVYSIYYFKPGSLIDFYVIKDLEFNYPDAAKNRAQDTINRFVRPWNGFGKVEMIPLQ